MLFAHACFTIHQCWMHNPAGVKCTKKIVGQVEVSVLSQKLQMEVLHWIQQEPFLHFLLFCDSLLFACCNLAYIVTWKEQSDPWPQHGSNPLVLIPLVPAVIFIGKFCPPPPWKSKNLLCQSLQPVFLQDFAGDYSCDDLSVTLSLLIDVPGAYFLSYCSVEQQGSPLGSVWDMSKQFVDFGFWRWMVLFQSLEPVSIFLGTLFYFPQLIP